MNKQAIRLFIIIIASAFTVIVLLLSSTRVRASSVSKIKTGAGVVVGIVWQDYCRSDCTAGSSLRRGNGVPEEAEPRLKGVQIDLSRGRCEGRKPFMTTTTDKTGHYIFRNLAPGYYCVSLNSRYYPTSFPRPGKWTSPSGLGFQYVARKIVSIVGNTGQAYVHFGWVTTP